MKSRGAAIDHAEVDLFPQPDQSGQDPLPVEFVCPSCREVLVVDREGWYCKREDLRFSPDGGIPSFLLPRRKEALQKFLDAYKQIRKTEGWGGPGSCEELPYRDRGGKHRWIWSIRARTFDCFLSHLSQRFPNGHARLLDLGAGNCWLALRMAEREFTVVALDINLDAYDGLVHSPSSRLRSVPESSWCNLSSTLSRLPGEHSTSLCLMRHFTTQQIHCERFLRPWASSRIAGFSTFLIPPFIGAVMPDWRWSGKGREASRKHLILSSPKNSVAVF